MSVPGAAFGSLPYTSSSLLSRGGASPNHTTGWTHSRAVLPRGHLGLDRRVRDALRHEEILCLVERRVGVLRDQVHVERRQTGA